MKTIAIVLLGLLALTAAIEIKQQTVIAQADPGKPTEHKGHHHHVVELHELEHNVVKADHRDVQELKLTLGRMTAQVHKSRHEDAEHFQRTKHHLEHHIKQLEGAIKRLDNEIKEKREHQQREGVQENQLKQELKQLAKSHADLVRDIKHARHELAEAKKRFRLESHRLHRVTAETDKLRRTLLALVHKLHRGEKLKLVEVRAVAAAVAARDHDDQSVRDVVEALRKDDAGTVNVARRVCLLCCRPRGVNGVGLCCTHALVALCPCCVDGVRDG